MTLKTQYELASSRFIKSKYAEQIELQKKKEREEQQLRLDSVPEFVNDWNNPNKKDTSEEYDVAFIERSSEKSANSKKTLNINEKEDIKMIEPETVYYNDKPELHWYGNFNSYTGFSKMNRSFVFGLSNKGVKVKIDNQQTPVEINQATMKELNLLEGNEISPKSPKVFSAMIPLKSVHEGRKIIYTMIESSETVHPDYIGKINLFDEIWVPTNFNKNLLISNGARPPIYIMPLGVDTNRYNPKAHTYNIDMDLNDFVFISVFKWNYRKGWDVLLKSYMEEFSSEDNVSLLIVSRTDVYHKPDVILNDFTAVKNTINKKEDYLPHVGLFDEKIHEKDMPSLYKRANAFVLISRGEGFGYPYCEAAACGLPVIGSNCSGQTDYLSEDNSFLVEPDDYIKATVGGNMSGLAKSCRFYENQVFPNFGRQSIEQTKQHMRYIYENYKSAKEKAKKLTSLIHTKYSLENSINNVFKRVLDLQN